MTFSAMDRVQRDRLRPLSSATDLTDTTYSTIEADSDPQSDDDREESETQSCTPSLYDFPRRYGRTFHAYNPGSYLFPNDGLEIERLNMEHAIIFALFHKKNYFAPLKLNKPKRILDIGCGTGTWCFEMALDFPNCRVEGIDLSPIQPTRTWENLDFYVDDITDDEWWINKQPPYNYIHTGMSLGSFTDFREIIQKSYNNLKPGGWMESHEIFPTLFCDDHTMPADYPPLEWQLMLDKAAMQLGKPLRIANKLKRWYEQAGFVDVHEEIFPIPVSSWPRDERMNLMGKFWGWNMVKGLQGWTMEFFVQGLGWSQQEVEVYLSHVRKGLADKSVHAYYKVYVVWGRRPTADEPQSTTPKGENWPEPPPHAAT